MKSTYTAKLTCVITMMRSARALALQGRLLQNGTTQLLLLQFSLMIFLLRNVAQPEAKLEQLLASLKQVPLALVINLQNKHEIEKKLCSNQLYTVEHYFVNFQEAKITFKFGVLHLQGQNCVGEKMKLQNSKNGHFQLSDSGYHFSCWVDLSTYQCL